MEKGIEGKTSEVVGAPREGEKVGDVEICEDEEEEF